MVQRHELSLQVDEEQAWPESCVVRSGPALRHAAEVRGSQRRRRRQVCAGTVLFAGLCFALTVSHARVKDVVRMAWVQPGLRTQPPLQRFGLQWQLPAMPPMPLRVPQAPWHVQVPAPPRRSVPPVIPLAFPRPGSTWKQPAWPSPTRPWPTGVGRSRGPSRQQIVRPNDFRVMQWNVLADGLSADGFVVPLEGLRKRESSGWDGERTFEDLTAPVSATAMPMILNNASMSEFIEDQLALQEKVITPLTARLQAKFGSCYDKRVHLKVLGTCVGAISDDLPLYAGHQIPETVKSFIEETTSTFAEETMHFQMPPTELPPRCTTLMQKFSNDGSLLCIGKARKGKRKSGRSPVRTSGEAEDILRVSIAEYVNAMERLNRKWGLKLHAANLDSLLDWGSSAADDDASEAPSMSGRGMRLVNHIYDEDPDIVAMQELDHFRFMQNMLGDVYTSNWSDGTGPQLHDHQRLCEEVAASTGYAFLPKCESIAAKSLKSRKGDDYAADNDGCALFWKSSRFKAREVRKFIFKKNEKTEGKGGGVVGVLLEDLKPGPLRLVWAFTTHLDSGDGEKDERSRLLQIAEFHEAINIPELVRETAMSERANVGALLMMDGNSYQGFTSETYNPSNNMYHSVMADLNLTDVEMETPDDGASKQTAMNITASVNKIRGASSLQPSKIGNYQLDRIDYVAFSDASLSQRSFPDLARYHGDDQATAFNEILPSVANPSDHKPIVVNLGWNDQTEIFSKILPRVDSEGADSIDQSAIFSEIFSGADSEGAVSIF